MQVGNREKSKSHVRNWPRNSGSEFLICRCTFLLCKVMFKSVFFPFPSPDVEQKMMSLINSLPQLFYLYSGTAMDVFFHEKHPNKNRRHPGWCGLTD